MGLKPLIKKMSFTELTATCEREGWRLPTFKEVNGSTYSGWISDTAVGQADVEALYYNHELGKVEFINQAFMLPCVVVKLPCTHKSMPLPNNYETECGHKIFAGVGFKYCPYCGREISFGS